MESQRQESLSQQAARYQAATARHVKAIISRKLRGLRSHHFVLWRENARRRIMADTIVGVKLARWFRTGDQLALRSALDAWRDTCAYEIRQRVALERAVWRMMKGVVR